MKITFSDKVLLGNILPKEGSFETLILSRDVYKKIEISQEDMEEFEIKPSEDGKAIQWSIKKSEDNPFDIDFSESEKNFISGSLKKISEKEALTPNLIPLYEKFVLGKEPEPTKNNK